MKGKITIPEFKWDSHRYLPHIYSATPEGVERITDPFQIIRSTDVLITSGPAARECPVPHDVVGRQMRKAKEMIFE